MSQTPGLSALGTLGATQWQAQWQAAQAGRLEGHLEAAQGAAKKATAGKGADPAARQAQMKQVVKVSQDFESLFLAYLFKTMRQAVPKTGFLGGSQAHEIFTEMRDEELAKGMAKAGGIGLAKLLQDQLKKSLDRQA